MAASISSRLLPARDSWMLLIKWVVALLVPVTVFTIWSGESIVNLSLLGLISPPAGSSATTGTPAFLLAIIFTLIFYTTIIMLVGYLVAADSGRRNAGSLWLDVAVFALLPLILILSIQNLIFGLFLCAIIWPIYFVTRNRIRKAMNYVEPAPYESLEIMDEARKADLIRRGAMGGFWFASAFALIMLVVDLIYYFSGSFPAILLVWVIVRTIALPVLGFFLGRLGGVLASRRTLQSSQDQNVAEEGGEMKISKRQLERLSVTRASEEARELVPSDLPLRSKGAQRFYILLLTAFVLFYPVIDPYLFGPGTDGRLSGYGDAGYYVILALGLNIVVGFAGLLDLGYVAFFAIGSYVWGMIGSPQWTVLTGQLVNPNIWPWLFWPVLIIAALIAALWGVVLGAPTLRLRGDYLAIVTLGFGEIVPVVFRELDKYTNGINGIVGVYPPAFPGVEWTSFTAAPYYYLILALIALCIFINIRLRDSRLGRAWIAIREDEIAAASSGVNLVNTKLFAFGAGAFFSGIAGAYHSAKLGTVSPDNFGFGDSVIYLAMVVIGGLGSIPGVIVGAIAVYAVNLLVLNQLDSLASDPTNVLHSLQVIIPGFTFGNIRNLIFGVILVVIMIFRPEGLIPSTRRRREFHKVEEEEVPEVGALDAVPGSPGFESEVHVE